MTNEATHLADLDTTAAWREKGRSRRRWRARTVPCSSGAGTRAHPRRWLALAQAKQAPSLPRYAGARPTGQEACGRGKADSRVGRRYAGGRLDWRGAMLMSVSAALRFWFAGLCR